VRIAARLDLPVDIAGLAADTEDFLKLVVIGFDLVPGNTPVLLRNVMVSRARFWKMSLWRSNFSSSYTLGF